MSWPTPISLCFFAAEIEPLLILSLSKEQDWAATEVLRSVADANVFANESHDTALYLAADRGQASLIRELINTGANLNMTNKAEQLYTKL